MAEVLDDDLDLLRDVVRVQLHPTHDAAQRLYKAQTINGFSFDLEILYLADKLGYKIAEVPVAWVDAPGSKVDPAKEVRRFLRDLVKIKANDLRGVYAHA